MYRQALAQAIMQFNTGKNRCRNGRKLVSCVDITLKIIKIGIIDIVFDNLTLCVIVNDYSTINSFLLRNYLVLTAPNTQK